MLRIRDLVFDAYGRRFFDEASATVPAGAKVGLVGRNGTGKSTLFRLLKGEFTVGGGAIEWPKAWRVAAVDQEHAATPIPLLDTVLAADEQRERLTRELETANPEHLGEIYARLAEIRADAAPARASEILAGLGFSQDDLARPMAEFSGGWRMRVAMAAALFAEPDLLLLDEPTNYLDLEGALWLEARLRKYPRTAVIISHDREILDQACDSILHLHDRKLDFYAGNYSSFERQRGEKLRLQAATREKIEARRAHMQSFVDRFRYKASKAVQAQSRLKMIARLADIPEVMEAGVAPILLPSPERPLSPPLIRLEGAAVGYGGAPVLKRLNLRLDVDDRIGLLGVNGAGKSTFARLLAGDLGSSAGEMHRDRRMKVGWFHQHQIEAMDPEDTPLSIIRRALPDASEAQRRSRLARFGMTAEKVETKVADLSGGERARLLLNLVAMEKPHLLILDEPTNHLDIDSRRALTDALNDYAGAVILITHDRSLMEMVADRLWLTAAGTILPFDGDMDDYAKLVVGGRSRPAEKAPKPAARAAFPAPKPTAAAPLKRKLEAAEATLARETRALAELDSAIARETDYAEMARLADRRSALARKVETAEAAWMQAAEALEGVI